MKKNVLYTSADKGLAYWRDTEPLFRDYADRCGASVVVLPKTRRSNLTWCIFDAFEHSLSDISEEASFAWIDADVVIHPEAPDVFSLADKLFVAPPDPPARVHPRWRRVHYSRGVQNVRPYPITSVVRWSKRHAERLLPYIRAGKFNKAWGDQEVLALACFDLELAFAYIPQHWHAMTKHVTKATRFYHAAGGEKGKKINHFLELLKKT
jgi:hypothetical protein